MAKERLNLVAKNDQGELVSATDAEPKTSYKCPNCGCKMHISHRLGRAFFVCYPNCTHTGKICSRGKATVHDIGMTDKKVLFKGLYTEGRKGTKKSEKGYGARQSENIVQPVSALKQLYEMGFHRMVPKNPMIGNVRIGDIIITPDLVASVMQDNDSLHDRVVYVFVDGFNDTDHTIRFVMLKKGKPTYKKVFLLVFEHNDAKYEEYRKQLFDEDRNPVVKTVLLAAPWEEVVGASCRRLCPKACKKGTWECAGMQKGNYFSEKQIFIPPEKDDAF